MPAAILTRDDGGASASTVPIRGEIRYEKTRSRVPAAHADWHSDLLTARHIWPDDAYVRTIGTTVAKVIAEIRPDWRPNMRKLAMLARLEKGWDYPDSQPMDPGAQANYLDWVTTIAVARMDDADPSLTDDGSIRLEWRAGSDYRIAEIGRDSLYLCNLAADRNDDSVELDAFDPARLTKFFEDGALR